MCIRWHGLRLAQTVVVLVTLIMGVGPTALLHVSSASAAARPVRVMVSPLDNLQFMSFWVAKGAGFFAQEGIEVRVFGRTSGAEDTTILVQGHVEVAVLQPPLYGQLIAQGQPVLVFANLLENDPINLVVRKEVVQARQLSPTAPLAERLRGMQGLRVGAAFAVGPRLRVLFAAVGMDADRDIEWVVLGGDEQNPAFGQRQVDALYTHTPHLEEALARQGGVLLVNQSGGEVPALTGFQIHSLVTTRAFAGSHPQVLVAFTRAIYRAQQLVHADMQATADAVLRSGVPGLERRLVEVLLPIYQPAIPRTPAVSIEGIQRAQRLFGPGGGPRGRVELSASTLAEYVAPQFAQEAMTTVGQPAPAVPLLVIGGTAGALLVALAGVLVVTLALARPSIARLGAGHE